MTSLAILLALTRILYSFPVGKPEHYKLAIHFDGYMPILGGKQGVVDVDLGISVSGLDADAAGNPRERSEITSAEITLFGAKLPFGASNLQTTFPATTISMTPEGKVLKTDAPSVVLPVRLPGLDSKRFPEVSYLPIEFPVEGVEVGRAFTYEKDFGTSKMQYVVTPTKLNDDLLEMRIELTQSYDGLEDDGHNPAADESKAAIRVHTKVHGEGTVEFDRHAGRVLSTHIEVDAVSDAEVMATHTHTARDLHTVLNLARD